MERTSPGPNNGRQQLLDMLGNFMELLSAIRPLTTDVGEAYLWGEDIPGADVGHLHGVVALRDDLVGLQHYLKVCGIDVPVPSILVARGDMAQLELAKRNEPRLSWTPTRPRKPLETVPRKRPMERRGPPVIEAGP